jgi:hypothetical protein
MILAALLLQAAAMPPADWAGMPDYPLPPFSSRFDPSPYVRREVEAGRCHAEATGGIFRIDSPVALLVDAGGVVQRIVPLAIGCPTVEQYTVGLVSSLARQGVAGAALKPGWYRYVAGYRWTG